DDRVERVTARIRAGNAYVNRNQIGAVVGSQPFGGEGLSGTGPKAGGPFYLPRLQRGAGEMPATAPDGPEIAPEAVASALAALDGAAWAARGDRLAMLRAALGPAGRLVGAALAAAEALPQAPLDMPGPTGESNRLSLHPRGRVLCLGAGAEVVLAQAVQALAAGNAVLAVAADAPWALAALEGRRLPVTAIAGQVAPASLEDLPELALVAAAGPADWLGAIRRALGRRGGPIVPLVTRLDEAARYGIERHLCIDTTAAGGNASLLAATA
ncbi:MAG TPA: aldehyde dehydrogenase family protein, partial [Amaricoccus sp.]|nr:aldehyde dehydrogenase family protein [Amaricoccus sp.]